MRTLPAFVACLTVAAVSLAVPRASAQELPLELAERYALADDRAAVLDTLIPGSPGEVYHRCLLLQNEGRLHAVDEALADWIARNGRNSWTQRLENRQALLRYESDPSGTFAFLRERLGLRFEHQRQLPGQKPDVPSRLDPAVLDSAALRANALQRHPGTLDGFRTEALPALLDGDLDGDLLRALLTRLQRPDLPGLAALVVRDLHHRNSRGLGSLGIHKRLLLDQLLECRRLMPELGDQSYFVNQVLQRMQPGPDVDLEHDAAARERHLEALAAFTRTLSPVFNSLKAHVLYHRLAHDRAQGVFDDGRFREYLALPRGGPWRNANNGKRLVAGAALVDGSASFPTGLPAIGSDDALIDAGLEAAFRAGADWKPYTEWLRDEHLRRVYAETRILYGLGEPQQWAALLDDPAAFERLRDRVEIAFAPTQPVSFGARDAVSVDVDLKHVDTLLVRVFEIDAFGFYTEREREVDAAIDLDGLVANEETSYEYGDNPLRRVRHHFEFPSLAGPGVFVIEFVGNGVASRALVRKGELHLLERRGAAGHVFRVLDDDGAFLSDAALWMDGRLFPADDEGEIAVPYSTDGGRRTVVLVHGERATLATFQHEDESYELLARAFVEREQLLARGTATLLLRPELRVNGHAASLELLEDPLIVITATDRDGTSSRQELRDPAFAGDAEWAHAFQVPEGLATLRVDLNARVRSLSEDELVSLVAPTTAWSVNEIDAGANVAAPLLGRGPDGWWIDVLGKAGEPIAGRAVTVTLRLRDYADELVVALATDARGRIDLGPLPGVTDVSAQGFDPRFSTWELQPDGRSLPERLTGVVGELLRLPFPGRVAELSREVVSLIELRDEQPAVDRFANVGLSDGFLVLRDLPAGEYELLLPESAQSVAVRVLPGQRRGDWLVGSRVVLPAEGAEPLHITQLAADDDGLLVQLANAGPEARVHVLATRWLPTFDPFLSLLSPAARGRADLPLAAPDTSYHAGRVLGDEYRYVLERRFAQVFPGNMLRRPSLLLNPWSLDEVDTAFGSSSANSTIGVGGGGSGFRSRAGGKPTGGREPDARSPGRYANLDFLPEPAVLLTNLRPDATGRVRVARADLGAGGMLSVLALDDESTVSASLTLPEQPLAPRSVSLARPLDPARHVSEQRRIEFVPAGASAVIDDVTTSEVATLDTLAAVYRLFGALGGAPDLPRFAFLVRWPELSREEQLARYDEFACHELHVFLHEHDRPFFDEIVRPYLANKLHKRFLDHWLLDDDLTPWLEPWRFAELNTAERILLARRLPAQAAAVTRLVREAVELDPTSPAERRQRFDAALRGGALEGGPSLGQSVREAAEALMALGYVGDDSEENEDYNLLPSESASEADAAPGAPAAVAPSRTSGGRVARGGSGRAKTAAKDVALRAQQRALYRGPDATREWIESDYWHRRPEDARPDLVPPDAFWLDFAEADPAAPFVSPNVIDATASLTEMLLALAFLDLPFAAGEHETTIDGARMTLAAGSPLLLVRQELREAAPLPDAPGLLVSQELYRLDERYAYENGQRRDRFVGDELLAGVPYGSQVVLTNPTSSSLSLELLLQVPSGAVPVNRGFRTRGFDVELSPYSTRTVDHAFYLPATGGSRLYPAHVSLGGEYVTSEQTRELSVVREPSTVDTGSWSWVSQQGSLEQVLAYIERNNPAHVAFGDIAWRLHERPAFDAIVGALRERKLYSSVVWLYGLLHGDARSTREYLEREPGFADQCGRVLATPLLTLEPIERLEDLHVEYEPLFNARAHRFGAELKLDNAAQAARYADLLALLAERPVLRDEDRLRVTYQLLLQDRVADALAQFARIDPERLPTRIQYDYLAAYLDFFSADHALARGIAERYREHPVPRWRARFAEVLAQLDEAEGRVPTDGDGDDRTRQLTDLAGDEPELSLDVEAGVVKVSYQNLSRCELRYTLMDLEFLFSSSPFVGSGAAALPPIRPARRDVLELPADKNTVTLPLPDEFRGRNVVVEVRGGGQVQRETYTANRLDLRLVENYGQLTVTHAGTGKPLPSTYVKVYARLSDGTTRFHKDGYTDLRGRFDYASLSADDGRAPRRFAILVLSAEDGAVVREVDAPAR